MRRRPDSRGRSATLSNPRGSDINLRAEAQLLEYRAIAARIISDRPRKTLDWGCGHGQMSALLAASGLDVVPFDHRPDLNDVQRERLSRYPELEVTLSGHPVELPFAEASFDAVLSCGVLEHVPRPGESLAELRRVLAPRGTLYVFKLPNRFSWLEWVARRLGLYYHGAYQHDRVYTVDSARALVESTGFTVQELRLANMLPLTLTGPYNRIAVPLFSANRALARVPWLNRVATNLELVAQRRE